MGKRRFSLGLIFNFNPKWTGGIIYLLNTVKILKFLEDKDMPFVFIFYKPELKNYIEQIDYPYLKKIEWNFPSIYHGYLLSWLKHQNLFVEKLISENSLDAVYPVHDYPIKSSLPAKVVAWYADLQHMYYPNYFTKKKIFQRNNRIKFMLRNSSDLVVSSETVKNDFYKFFNVPASIKIHIYRFVSIIDELPNIRLDDLRKKYDLPENYFMISNQFHKHKNHKVVFKALAEIKSQKSKLHIAITGRFPSQPNSPYMKELHDILKKNRLDENISLLGLIPRGEQLLLMKHSQAVIQPSLFEGWSTVIEDAKSLQVPVIASDLPVNIEQLKEKGTYFSACDYQRLAAIISSYPERDYNHNIYEDYETRMKQAAKNLMSIFK